MFISYLKYLSVLIFLHNWMHYLRYVGPREIEYIALNISFQLIALGHNYACLDNLYEETFVLWANLKVKSIQYGI